MKNNIVKKLSRIIAGSMIMVMLIVGCSYAAPNDMERGGNQPPQQQGQRIDSQQHGQQMGGQPGRDMGRRQPEPPCQQHDSRPQPHRDSGRGNNSTDWGLVAVGAVVGGILATAVSSGR